MAPPNMLSAMRSGSSGLEEKRGALLATGAAISVMFCIMVPRIGPLVLVSFTTLICVLVLLRETREPGDALNLRRIFFRPETPFIAWILIACLWSASPTSAFLRALFLGVLILHAVILAQRLSEFEQRDIEAVSKGLLVGFLLAGLYVCLEIIFRNVITKFALTHFPEIERGVITEGGVKANRSRHGMIEDGILKGRSSTAHPTRITSVFCLFLAPAVLAAAFHTRGLVRLLTYAAIAMFLLVILFHPRTTSQTAELIVVAAVLTLCVSWLAPKLAKWMTALGFAGLLLLAVPAPLAMVSAGLHQNEAIFKSARSRIIIWHFTAEQTLNSPIVGVGTYSTRFLHEERAKKGIATPPGFVAAPATRAHPHNVYLQIWYELGVIGILAFAILGFSLFRNIALLPKRAFPFALTHFVICMLVIAPSYSLWQAWFQSVIVLSILALIVVSNRLRDDDVRTFSSIATRVRQP